MTCQSEEVLYGEPGDADRLHQGEHRVLYRPRALCVQQLELRHGVHAHTEGGHQHQRDREQGDDFGKHAGLRFLHEVPQTLLVPEHFYHHSIYSSFLSFRPAPGTRPIAEVFLHLNDLLDPGVLVDLVDGVLLPAAVLGLAARLPQGGVPGLQAIMCDTQSPRFAKMQNRVI